MTIADQPFGDLLDGLASKAPTPGGGAVAGMTAATAAATAEMVVAYSVDKKSLVSFRDQNLEAQQRLQAWRHEALHLADADAQAYSTLNRLWKLPKDDADRVANWTAAVDAAIAAPQGVLTLCTALAECLDELATTTNPMLASDLAIAAILTSSAASCATWNVRVNLPLLDDQTRATALDAACSRSTNTIQALVESIEQCCRRDT
ncbi:MAG: cyclodeaminase/cyclohydrolase family protein [Planctomycetota bacterium]